MDAGRGMGFGTARTMRLAVDGRDVAQIELAATYVQRLRGMLLRTELPDGLLLAPCGSVHGMGMTRSLDVAFLVPVDGRRRQVLGDHRVARTSVLRPLGLSLAPRGATRVLEAPVGSFARWGLTQGCAVRVTPSGSTHPVDQ